MGEIAEDYYEGHCCSGCMAYFKHPHGHPVLCKECWSEYSKRERKDYQCATHEEI
jgi:predicted amidophosphoribosyltransferase